MSDGLFSRKDRRYWLTITGGMVIIGIVNLVIGYLMWDDPPPPPPPHAFPRPVVPGSKSPWPSSLDAAPLPNVPAPAPPASPAPVVPVVS